MLKIAQVQTLVIFNIISFEIIISSKSYPKESTVLAKKSTSGHYNYNGFRISTDYIIQSNNNKKTNKTNNNQLPTIFNNNNIILPFNKYNNNN